MSGTSTAAADPTPGRADAVLGQLMLAFEGEEPPAWVRERLATAPPAGFTLFRHHNVRSPAQVRGLTEMLQEAAPPGLPFLVAADQEGGQFQALGEGPTPFAGAMALGAAGDERLAEQVGRAIGTELAAMGVNVCYAPVADVAVDRRNPALGIRSFGAEAPAVAGMVAATVRGIQAAGVAATLKHFPGKGAVAIDTHHALGVVDHDRARLDEVELAPFRAGLEAGARLVMSGHFAVPALTGDADLPATLAPEVMTRLLRDELGFRGLTITDALDMKALDQGPNQVLDVLAALRAGVDLLLLAVDPLGRERVTAGLRHAARRGLVAPTAVARSLARIEALRRWVARATTGAGRPPLEMVGCLDHRALSRALAERSLTLVRDAAGLIPLRLPPGERILAVMPQPVDLTPADTSSTVPPGLASALRRVFPAVDEMVTTLDPDDAEITGIRARAAAAGAVVVGTIAAAPGSGQARLVEAVLATGTPTVTVALRTPWDLAAYPAAPTHLCTYSILPDPLDALAGALAGRLVPSGALPVSLERPVVSA